MISPATFALCGITSLGASSFSLTHPFLAILCLGTVYMVGWLEGRFRSAVCRGDERVMVVASSYRAFSVGVAFLCLLVFYKMICTERTVHPIVRVFYTVLPIVLLGTSALAFRYRVTYSDTGIRRQFLGVRRNSRQTPWSDVRYAEIRDIEQLALYTTGGVKYRVYYFMRGRSEFEQYLRQHRPHIAFKHK